MRGPAVEPADLRGAAVGALQAEQDANGRGLPSAVGAEEAEDLTLGDAERDPVERVDVAEALGETVDLDDRRHGSLG